MQYDLIVVGAGVLGLSHAYHAARAGLKVAVLERGATAEGASVRNFGMLAIVAQSPGAELESARTSLAHWQEITAGAGIALRQAGCLFLARREVELCVLQECAADAAQAFRLITADQLSRFAPGLSPEQHLGGLWSPEAWKIDQRQAMTRMARWLARVHGVTFHFGTPALAIDSGCVQTPLGEMQARHVLFCGGDAFSKLFPEAFRATGVSRCQLQMMRTVPQPKEWRLDPFVLGGLSITRYGVFQSCPSLAALAAWQAEHQSAHLAHGIHLVAGQEEDGSLTIGDSHAYGDDPSGERQAEVDALIEEELAGLITLPRPGIAERWLGHYAHLSGQTDLVLTPRAGVTAVTVTNGQGMTHALSLANRVIGGIL